MKLLRLLRGHRALRALAIVPLIGVLQMAVLISAVHQHAFGPSADTCAACVASHAPAVGAHALAAPVQPLALAGTTYVAPVAAPRDRTPLVAFGRSPPEA